MNCLRNLLAVSLVPLASPAQTDRELSTPTATYWNTDRTPAQVDAMVQQGWRITDLEVESTSPWKFTVAMVPNSGPYQIGWAWYYGLDATELAAALNQNQARLIDLEPYDSNGQTRFAAIMVDNTGSNARSWGWLFNTDTSAIGQNVAQYGNRIVDLDRYQIGGTTHYAAVLTANSGADARAWSWGINLTAAQVAQQVNASSAQIVDLEPHGNNYDVVMQQNPGNPPWWYYFGVTGNQVTETLSQIGARAIDIESYATPQGRRFHVVMINNSNALSTRISEILRTGTDGTTGVYLKQVNGPVLAYINGDHNFEPASSIKVMFHAHAMKRVQGGLDLMTSVRIPGMSGACYSFNSFSLRDLRETLRLMMQNSDNPSTVAIQNHFTNDAINQSMSSPPPLGLGLGATNVLRFLCPSPLNESTLTDFGRVHEGIANGWLDAPTRQTFYTLMNTDLTYGGVINVASLIDEEAAALSLPANVRDAFKAQAEIAWKAGGWNRGPGLIHLSTFEWLKLPFRNGPFVTPREYVSGVFVDFASSEATAGAAMNLAKREVLRDIVREALGTWTGYVGGSFQTFGTGCPGSGGTPQLTASGAFEAGTSVAFDLANGRAGSLAVLALGASRTTYLGASLPLSLAFLGAPGCSLRCSLDASAGIGTNFSGHAHLLVGIPAVTSLIGGVLHTQWLVVDAAANQAGVTTSNGGTLSVGGYR